MTNVNPGNALELGTAIARASWDAALRSGAQASASVAEIGKLQTETMARLMNETLRTMQAMAAAPSAAPAHGEFARIYQEHLQRSAEAARGLWENALRTQNEMTELANRMLGASTRALAQGLDQVAVAMQQGTERSSLEPPQTAEAGVRRRDKAA